MTQLTREWYELDRDLVLAAEIGSRALAAITMERVAPLLVIDKRCDGARRRAYRIAHPRKESK